MLYTGATFIKKNSRVVARIVSFDTAGPHLHLSHVILHLTTVKLLKYPLIKSELCFQVFQLLKYDGNMLTT